MREVHCRGWPCYLPRHSGVVHASSRCRHADLCAGVLVQRFLRPRFAWLFAVEYRGFALIRERIRTMSLPSSDAKQTGVGSQLLHSLIHLTLLSSQDTFLISSAAEPQPSSVVKWRVADSCQPARCHSGLELKNQVSQLYICAKKRSTTG